MVLEINKVAKNLLSIGLSSFIAQLVMFFMIAYYARILSVEGFGRINLAQSILVYFSMITLFGFQTLGTREISKNKDKHGELVGHITFIRFIVAILCFILVLAISFTVNKGTVFKNILIIYGLTLFPIAFNIDWFFSGLQEMQYNGIYNVIKSTLPFILSIIFFKSESQIYYIPIFTLIGLIMAVAYQMYIFFIKKRLKVPIRLNKAILNRYTISAIPFLISGLLSMINCNIDSIIIGFTRSEYELGIYSSAYKIVFFLINLIAVIFTPFFPLLINYFHQKDVKNLEKIVKNICKIVILIGFPILVGGTILSKDIIILLFGKKYIEAYLPFIILLVYIFILFMRETYGYSLNAWNMEEKYLKSVIISSAVNLILNLIFIPKFGIVAAAITTLLSEIINFAIMRSYSIKVVKTNYIMNITKLILPVGIMALSIAVLKYFNINVLLNILAAIIIYFLSVIYFKYISKEDLRKLLKKNI